MHPLFFWKWNIKAVDVSCDKIRKAVRDSAIRAASRSEGDFESLLSEAELLAEQQGAELIGSKAIFCMNGWELGACWP